MSDDRPVIRVHPEPTDEEAAAIVAALQVIDARRHRPDPTVPPPSKWIAAARREAMRGLDNDNTR